MVSKVHVPMDFGVENLEIPSHGNITLKLKNDKELQANSLILSYNSAVFANLFFEQKLSSVEMTQYGTETASIFLKALYSGRIQLSNLIFRDINTLAYNYDVSWLISKCEDYFKFDVVETCGDDYESQCYAFEESRHARRATKNGNHFVAIMTRLLEVETRKQRFITNYMSEKYLYLSKADLYLMIKMADENGGILLKIMKNQIKANGMVFDNTSKYLIQHVDLEMCDKPSCDEVFDMLLDKGETPMKLSTAEDLEMVRTLKRNATEKRNQKNQDEFLTSIDVRTLDPNSFKTHILARARTVIVQGCELINRSNIVESTEATVTIPNLFHSASQLGLNPIPDPDQPSYYKKYTYRIDDILEKVATSSDFKNLYMVMELLIWCRKNYPDNRSIEFSEYSPQMVIEILTEISKIRGWGKLSSTFMRVYVCEILRYKYNRNEPDTYETLIQMVNDCKELTSDDESVQIVSNRATLSYGKRDHDHVIRIGEFLSKEGTSEDRIYKFYWKHPKTTACSNPGQCGFIIIVNTMNESNSDSFNIGICTNPFDYPEDIHYHADVMSVENIHFVLQRKYSALKRHPSPSEMVYVSWFGRPYFERNHIIWGKGIPTFGYIGIVVYYDLTK